MQQNESFVGTGLKGQLSFAIQSDQRDFRQALLRKGNARINPCGNKSSEQQNYADDGSFHPIN
jgi:hypothetical protein